jgi:preprotein translocase subunit SecE
MANVIEYVKDSYSELVERVTWPGPKQLQEASVLVFIASLLIAGIVFAMDWVFGVNSTESIWQGVIGIIYTLV